MNLQGTTIQFKSNFQKKYSQIEKELTEIVFNQDTINHQKNHAIFCLIRLKEIEERTIYFLGLALVPISNFSKIPEQEVFDESWRVQRTKRYSKYETSSYDLMDIENFIEYNRGKNKNEIMG